MKPFFKYEYIKKKNINGDQTQKENNKADDLQCGIMYNTSLDSLCFLHGQWYSLLGGFQQSILAFFTRVTQICHRNILKLNYAKKRMITFFHAIVNRSHVNGEFSYSIFFEGSHMQKLGSSTGPNTARQ